jgi:hypothetical protein
MPSEAPAALTAAEQPAEATEEAAAEETAAEEAPCEESAETTDRGVP